LFLDHPHTFTLKNQLAPGIPSSIVHRHCEQTADRCQKLLVVHDARFRGGMDAAGLSAEL
jgi:hypothetical protein